MSESIQELENKWAGLMAARYGAGHPRAGERIYEIDGKYAREVTALAVEIDTRKKAEASRPQINQQHLAWLELAQGATDKDGKRLYQPGSKYAENIQSARAKVFSGGDISVNIAAT